MSSKGMMKENQAQKRSGLFSMKNWHTGMFSTPCSRERERERDAHDTHDTHTVRQKTQR